MVAEIGRGLCPDGAKGRLAPLEAAVKPEKLGNF
jgi:hypothetical protein